MSNIDKYKKLILPTFELPSGYKLVVPDPSPEITVLYISFFEKFDSTLKMEDASVRVKMLKSIGGFRDEVLPHILLKEDKELIPAMTSRDIYALMLYLMGRIAETSERETAKKSQRASSEEI